LFVPQSSSQRSHCGADEKVNVFEEKFEQPLHVSGYSCRLLSSFSTKLLLSPKGLGVPVSLTYQPREQTTESLELFL
jgi:hypothetical protein